MTPQRAGKNHTSEIRSAARRGAATDTVTVLIVALRMAGHGLGPGTARRARSMADAVTAGAGRPSMTGRVRATSGSSGVQVFSHTSHEARPRSVTRLPSRASAGTVTRVSRTTSLV